MGVEPKIGVVTPPKHPFIHRVFHEINPSILGVLPLFLETPMWFLGVFFCFVLSDD